MKLGGRLMKNELSRSPFLPTSPLFHFTLLKVMRLKTRKKKKNMEITCAFGTVEVAVVVYNFTTSATTSTTFVTKQINSKKLSQQ